MPSREQLEWYGIRISQSYDKWKYLGKAYYPRMDLTEAQEEEEEED